MFAIDLGCGIGAFLLAFLLQVLSWRSGWVRREMLGLLWIFIVLPPLPVIGMALWLGGGAAGAVSALLLYWAVAAAYIQTYPALKEDIPSFRILLFVAAQGREGASAQSIVAAVAGGGLAADKLAELKADRLLEERGGVFTLSPAGRWLAAFFFHYRRLLGLAAGAG